MQKFTIFVTNENSLKMDRLRQLGNTPVSYAVLKSLYSNYKSPRNKIAELENKHILIRLKRGMYVVSPDMTGELLSTELLANHIYGPSYISMETALRFYGLIPESVHIIKSMTTKRSRCFKNLISVFDYISCSDKYYSIGIRQISDRRTTFLAASPEKALSDLIAFTPNLRPRFLKSMVSFLEEDLRMDMDEFYKMDVRILRECSLSGKKKNDLNLLVKLLQK